MPSVSREARLQRDHAERPDRKTDTRALDRTPGLDLTTRLREFQRTRLSRIQRQDTLLDMMRSVNSTLDPGRLADVILDHAATWVPAPCWAVVSADPTGHLSILADRALTPEMKPAIHAVAKWVMNRGGEFASADLRHDSRITDPGVGTVLAFPLGSRGKRVGALIGLDVQPSSREPKMAAAVLRAVRVLLEPAATALDNALHLKRAEALSVTDDLTRLYNSRYLNLVLRRETKRASRSGRPLSLLFIDLDGFKSINDTHGHLYGSRALVEAAAVVRGCARETDVVARFGGDEFSVILPDTGGEGAYAVGARIRQRIAEFKFLSDDGLNIHLTASVGVATLPDVAASPEELIQAADQAMYAVKESGKNNIQAATAPADT